MAFSFPPSASSGRSRFGPDPDNPTSKASIQWPFDPKQQGGASRSHYASIQLPPYQPRSIKLCSGPVASTPVTWREVTVDPLPQVPLPHSDADDDDDALRPEDEQLQRSPRRGRRAHRGKSRRRSADPRSSRARQTKTNRISEGNTRDRRTRRSTRRHQPHSSSVTTLPLMADVQQRLREKQGYALRRSALKKQKRQRHFKGVLRLLLVTATLLTVLLFFQAPLWQWHATDSTIALDGYLKTEAVREQLRQYEGQSLLQVNPEQVKRQLLGTFPLLANVLVRRQLVPARLDVVAVEHVPWAAVFPKTGEGTTAAQPVAFAVENHTLVSVPIGYYDWQALQKANPLLPILADADQLARILNKNPAFLQRLDTIVQHYQGLKELQLVSVSLNKDDELTVHFDGVDVLLGYMDEASLDRAARLAPVIPTIKALWPQVERVDLRWRRNVFLRKRPISMA